MPSNMPIDGCGENEWDCHTQNTLILRNEEGLSQWLFSA